MFKAIVILSLNLYTFFIFYILVKEDLENPSWLLRFYIYIDLYLNLYTDNKL